MQALALETAARPRGRCHRVRRLLVPLVPLDLLVHLPRLGHLDRRVRQQNVEVGARPGRGLAMGLGRRLGRAVGWMREGREWALGMCRSWRGWLFELKSQEQVSMWSLCCRRVCQRSC